MDTSPVRLPSRRDRRANGRFSAKIRRLHEVSEGRKAPRGTDFRPLYGTELAHIMDQIETENGKRNRLRYRSVKNEPYGPVPGTPFTDA